MLVNGENLRTLGIGFNASYQGGLGMAPTDHLRVATPVPSTTAANEYGWLGQLPGVREWLGDRVIHALAAHGYTIRNRDFELTVSVKRNDIEDDNIGIYAPMFTEMGRSAGAFPCELVWGLLAAGFLSLCYDGQYFFDTDHPVIAADGSITSVANTDGGNGLPWFLIDDTRALKPIILQNRRDWNMVSKDKPTDDNVFSRKEFIYGTDARMNVGFGFWQFAWGSRNPLTPASYAAARAAMQSFKGDHGRPLGITPKLLVVPPGLEAAAREILMAERNQDGSSNIWLNSATMLSTPWLV